MIQLMRQEPRDDAINGKMGGWGMRATGHKLVAGLYVLF